MKWGGAEGFCILDFSSVSLWLFYLTEIILGIYTMQQEHWFLVEIFIYIAYTLKLD